MVVAVLQPRSPHAAPNPPMAALPTGTRWIDIDEGRGVHLRAAVAWPEGRDPVPVVIVLHGTEGFNEDYVHLAEAFAGRGFIGVAGCWFAGNECPDGPRFHGVAAGSVAHLDALIAVGRGLPRARTDRIGLFGHSRGASLALWAASTGRDVRAVVGSSAQLAPGYTAGRRALAIDVSPITVLSTLRAPVLFLHALGDDVAPVREVWQYEHAAYELGKPVESRYFDTGDHGLPFARATRDDVLRRASEFLKRHFQP